MPTATSAHEPATVPPIAENGNGDIPPVEVVKASFNLPRRELDALKRIAAIKGINATQALRQAIATLKFLTDLPPGSRIFVREQSGSEREVVFQNF